MRKEMFIYKNEKNREHDLVYSYLSKGMFSRRLNFEKNKHRDSSTC